MAPRDDVEEVGDLGYGGYLLPTSQLGADSVCYLIGVGEDASFDLAIIRRFGCVVHAFDPTPRAVAYAQELQEQEPRFQFHPYAIWPRDERLTFHAPREPGYVSQSATNLHGTAADFVAEGRSLASIMRQLGHQRIDLLKISAEGAEYAILDELLHSQLPVTTLCVEFAQPVRLGRPRECVQRLKSAGFVAVGTSIRPWNWKLTWLHSRAGT